MRGLPFYSGMYMRYYVMVPHATPAVVGSLAVYNMMLASALPGSCENPTLDGTLFAFDALTGQPVWTNGYGSFFNTSAKSVAGWSNVGAANGLLYLARSGYLGTGDNAVAAFRLDDGSAVWEQVVLGASTSLAAGGPVTDGVLVYATFADGMLLALDAQNGTMGWTMDIGVDPQGRPLQPVLSGTTLYVGSGSSVLMLDAASGAITATVPVTPVSPGEGILSYASVLDPANRLFFYTGGAGLPDVLRAYDLTPVFAGGSAIPLWQRNDLRASALSSASGFLAAVNGDYQFTTHRFGTVTLDPATGTILQHFEGIPQSLGVTWKYVSGIPTPVTETVSAPLPWVGNKMVVGGNDNDIDGLAMVAPGPGVLPPTNLSAMGRVGAIDLAWEMPPAQSFAIAGFTVYRSTFDGFDFGNPASQVTQVASSLYSDTDSALMTGLLYYYVVKAFDANGNLSSPSNVAFASDPLDGDLISPPEGATVDGIVVMMGTAGGSEFTGYEVRVWPQGRSDLAVLVAEGTRPVLKGTLGYWLALTDLHGPHVVELRVKGKNGHTLSRSHTVHLGRAAYFTDILPDGVRAGNMMAEGPMPAPARLTGTDARAPPRTRRR